MPGGDSLCIVDEAYMDFFGHSIIDYAVTKENVIVLRTCSKAIGLASARLGFAISNAKLIELINRIRSPYSVNAFGQAVGKVVFSDPDYIRTITQKIVNERETLYKGLCALVDKYPGRMTVLPSRAISSLPDLRPRNQLIKPFRKKVLKSGIGQSMDIQESMWEQRRKISCCWMLLMRFFRVKRLLLGTDDATGRRKNE